MRHLFWSQLASSLVLAACTSMTQSSAGLSAEDGGAAGPPYPPVNAADCLDPRAMIRVHTASDLQTLSSCAAIEGSLSIWGTTLADLHGLESLTRIEGTLAIGNNPALTSVAPLGNLRKLGSLHVTLDPLLAELDAFAQLSSLADAEVDSCNGLTTIDGLGNLQTLGTFKLAGCRQVTQLPDFAPIASLEQLELSNTSLSDLHGLESLQSVQGELRITDNTELTRVSGLDQLTTAGQLRISNNHNLPQACVDALAGRLTAAPRATDVTGNGTGDCH